MENLQENQGVTGRVYKFLNSVVSDVGVKRTENQDAFSIAHTREASLFVVADGMGGARGGATASALAASIVGLEAFNPDGSITVDSFRRVIEQANLAINARSQRDKDLKGMGTTIAAIAFVGNKALVSSVGDSRVYFYRKGDFRQLTKDHTFVQELVEKGAIKIEEAASHPISHMLTRSLGPVDKVLVDSYEFEIEVAKGDRFLICSDGLYNHVPSAEIGEILAQLSPNDASRELLNLAIERGGSDNITIQIIEAMPLEDTGFIFPVPRSGKVEINLLGKIEEKQIGSEFDLEQEFFEIENSEIKHEEPRVVKVEKEQKTYPFKTYSLVASVLAILAFFVFLFNKDTDTKQAVSPSEKTEEVAKFSEDNNSVTLSKVETVLENKNSLVEEPDDEPEVEVAKEYNMEVVDKVVQQATAMEIPEPPVVKIEHKQSPPDQPIVWENEELKLEKIKNMPTEKKLPEIEVDIDQSLARILELKQENRQKILDLDFKLQLLLPEFKQQQESIINKDSEEARIAIDALNTKLLEIEQQLETWTGLSHVYDQVGFVDFLEKTAKNSDAMSKIFNEYKSIDQDYNEAVKKWHANPRDLSLASSMGAKARKRDDFFKSTQDSVRKTVDYEIVKILEKYSDKYIEKEKAEQWLKSLSRRKGYLQSSFQLDSQRAVELRNQYMQEREEAQAKLEKYKIKLADENEHNLKKNIILSELKNKL